MPPRVTMVRQVYAFVAIRGAAKRLVAGLLALNDADVLRRVFPASTTAR